MAVDPKRRCWRFYKDGCRNTATGATRVGDVFLHHCDEHIPQLSK